MLIPFLLLLLQARALAGAPFDDLAAQFAAAEMPTTADLGALRSGRCYFASMPDDEVGGLLATQRLAPARFKLIPLLDGSGHPDLFDRLNDAQREVLARIIEDSAGAFTEVRRGDRGWTFTGGAGALFEVRKDTRNRLLLQAIGLRSPQGEMLCTYFRYVSVLE